MEKIKSPAELGALRERARAEIELRSGLKDVRITVHMGTCGIAAGARDVLASLVSELASRGVKNVSLTQTGCAGLCDQEPMLTLQDAAGRSFRYGKLDRVRVQEIIQEHVVGGNPVEAYLIRA